jgi:hypothetical protein
MRHFPAPRTARLCAFAGGVRAVIGLMAVFLTQGEALAEISTTTPPCGIYTVKVPGAPQADDPVRTYLGIQLLPDMRFVGLVGAVGGSTLSLENVATHSDLADPERKSYVHALDGAGRGFVTDIEAFRASDILCAGDLTPWIQPGTRVLIRPHSHLSDIFGAANRFGLAAAPDAGTADNVVVWDPPAQQERVYYFHSTRARWEEKDVVADASHAILRFPYGFYLVRRTPGTLRIALSGGVGSEAVLLPVRPGANVFSLPVNLSGSLDATIRANGAFSVISGPNAKRADILTFEEPTTGLQRGPFYHLSRPDASGWREVGVNGSTASIQPLDFLSTLVLRRDGHDAGYVLAEGSLELPAVPRPPLPPDPQPGELPLAGELPIPPRLPPNIALSVETSTDLQNWTTYVTPTITNDKAVFNLPSGQGRAFYRLRVTVMF